MPKRKIPSTHTDSTEGVQKFIEDCSFYNTAFGLRKIGSCYHIIMLTYDLETGLGKVVSSANAGTSKEVARLRLEETNAYFLRGLKSTKILEALEMNKKKLITQ